MIMFKYIEDLDRHILDKRCDKMLNDIIHQVNTRFGKATKKLSRNDYNHMRMKLREELDCWYCDEY